MILVTVSDDRFGRKDGQYNATQTKIKELFEYNHTFGINKFHMWTWEEISKTPFYELNKIMLDYTDPAMNGRLYKPFAINESLKEIDEGDFLIYTDCSPEMWKTFNKDSKIDFVYNLNIIKDLCVKNGGILTAHVKWNHLIHVEKGQIGYHTHENFTTESCLNTMGLNQYKYSLQHASGMIVLQKNEKSIKFANDWLYWNSKPECASLDPVYWSSIGWEKTIGHRHDQSISGLLINQMNNKLIETLDYYERNADFNAYNFLNFCKTDFVYNFFDSNQPPGESVFKMTCQDDYYKIVRKRR